MATWSPSLHIAGCVSALIVFITAGLTLREEFMGRVTERTEGGHAHGLVGALMHSETRAGWNRFMRVNSV